MLCRGLRPQLRTIESPILNHNFLALDMQPTGPDFTVTFPYEVKPATDMKGLAEVRGNKVVLLKTLVDRDQASSDLTGYGPTAKDYDFRVDNHKTGAGIHITADRPLSRFFFWSVPSTLCPEAYIDMKVEPGKDFSWSLTYDFYTLPTNQ